MYHREYSYAEYCKYLKSEGNLGVFLELTLINLQLVSNDTECIDVGNYSQGSFCCKDESLIDVSGQRLE